MKKVIWKTQEINLVAGETLANKEIHLERGERIVVAIEKSAAPGKIVNLGLYEGGNELSAPMALGFWERSNSGHYLDGFKPIEFKGGTTVTARIFTKAALAEDLAIQIVYGIIQDDTTC